MTADATPAAGTVERVADVPVADTLSPADRYQELFVAVQRDGVFSDSKSFVDCIPRQAPEAILEAYRRDRDAPGFDLARFVHAHFHEEKLPGHHYRSDPGQPLKETNNYPGMAVPVDGYVVVSDEPGFGHGLSKQAIEAMAI